MTQPRDDGKDAPFAAEDTDTRRDAADEPELTSFTQQEEAALLLESHSAKAQANALFSSQDYHGALARYLDAIASCPSYLNFERAVLQSNVSACHLKLEQWKEAIKAANGALDGLAEVDKQDPDPSGAADKQNASSSEPSGDAAPADGDVEEEVISSGALKSAPAPTPATADARKADVLRIRTKALLRRARARSEAGGWQNLAGAEEDYRTLAGLPGLGPADMRTVRAQLRALPPRTKAAQESEMAEMWGKLRQLGDGILKPFGLSTSNFQMVKDENTGGYSVNFSQGGAPSSST